MPLSFGQLAPDELETVGMHAKLLMPKVPSVDDVTTVITHGIGQDVVKELVKQLQTPGWLVCDVDVGAANSFHVVTLFS